MPFTTQGHSAAGVNLHTDSNSCVSLRLLQLSAAVNRCESELPAVHTQTTGHRDAAVAVGGGGWMGGLDVYGVTHLAVQRSVGQLPSRLLHHFADFFQLLLSLRCFVLRLLLLPAAKAQFRRKKKKH